MELTESLTYCKDVIFQIWSCILFELWKSYVGYFKCSKSSRNLFDYAFSLLLQVLSSLHPIILWPQYWARPILLWLFFYLYFPPASSIQFLRYTSDISMNNEPAIYILFMAQGISKRNILESLSMLQCLQFACHLGHMWASR